MNTKFLLLILIVAGFSSCSTAYKAGQTPDDVYYSPVRPQNDYVRTENNEDKNVYRDNTIYEDRDIRVRTHNRRWRRYNDYDYNYPYGNQYPPVYIDPKTGITTPAPVKAPRKTNLGGYKKPADNTDPTIKDLKAGTKNPTTTAPVRTFKQSTKNGSGVGNFLRQVFRDGSQSQQNNTDNSNSSDTRTYTERNSNNNNGNSNNSNSSSSSNSSSNNSSSNSGKSTSAPVRTFEKN